MLDPIYDHVPVAGLKYRFDACLDFMEAIDNGAPGGVRLEPEPENMHDANAIKVVGWWDATGDQPQTRHIGYVPAVLTDLMAYKRMSGLAAELAHYDLVDDKIVLEIRIGLLDASEF